MKISVAIISNKKTINQQILSAVKFADEVILIVDSKENIDKKNKQGTMVYFRPLDGDFASQRNFAISKCHSDWILFIDDDEYVSQELAKEIQELPKDTSFAGYRIPRIDVSYHQRFLHGETGNTRIIRLAKKKAGKFVRPVHEHWDVKGRIGELNSPIFHSKDHFVSEFIPRMMNYCQIDSLALLHEKKPFRLWKVFVNPIGKFIQNYLIKLGLLDGTIGLFQSYLMSIQSVTVRIFQWENQK